MMLDTPSKGFQRSVRSDEHRVDLEVMADWLEACISFSSTRISQRDIVDILCEKQIYAEPEFAQERVADAWTTLRERKRKLGNALPYDFDQFSLVRNKKPWSDCAPYSFLLTLSLSHHYPLWARGFGPDYTRQGELFEQITEQAMVPLFPGWSVFRTGWSRNQPRSLSLLVGEIATRLNEVQGVVNRWSKPQAKEAGLDLLLWKDFEDPRGTYPVYLFQCASGMDWEDKLTSPDLNLWTRLIDFRARGLPRKAFALPIVHSADAYTRNANAVDGLVFDRLRIMSASRADPSWASRDLIRQMRAWGNPRTRALPTYS